VKPTIVIHGPQGCGKTRNAEALRQHYGLDRVIEADERPHQMLPATGALVLTCRVSALHVTGLAIVPFDVAMQEIRGRP
jgi:broad-specificity NMP kinase